MSHMHGRDTCPHIPWIRPNATVNYYISPAHKKGGYLMKMVINFCNSCVPPVPPCLLILVRVSLYPMAFNWAIPASCICRSLIGMTTMLQDGLGRLSSSNFLLGFFGGFGIRPAQQLSYTGGIGLWKAGQYWVFMPAQPVCKPWQEQEAEWPCSS